MLTIPNAQAGSRLSRGSNRDNGPRVPPLYRIRNPSQKNLRQRLQTNTNVSLQRNNAPPHQRVSAPFFFPLRPLRDANNRFLISVLGDTFHQVVANRVTVVYEVDASAEVVAVLVQELENRKADLEIADWGISQATLDDVFIRLCGNAGHEG